MSELIDALKDEVGKIEHKKWIEKQRLVAVQRRRENEERMQIEEERERKLRIREEIEKLKEEARYKEWMRQKEMEAAAFVLAYRRIIAGELEKLSKVMDNLYWRRLTDPILQKYDLNEVNKIVKENIINKFREELKEKLKGNPYQHYTLWL